MTYYLKTGAEHGGSRPVKTALKGYQEYTHWVPSKLMLHVRETCMIPSRDILDRFLQ
jgi:hypothetical protein